jgi:hypothetical protein
MAKTQFDVGLSPAEARIVSLMAASKEVGLATMMGEIFRLGLPLMAESLTKIENWERQNEKK